MGPYRKLLVIAVDVAGDEQREAELRKQFGSEALLTAADYYNLPPGRKQVEVTVEGDRWMSLDDLTQFVRMHEDDFGAWEPRQLTRIFLNIERSRFVQCTNYVLLAEEWNRRSLEAAGTLRPHQIHISGGRGVNGLLLLSDLQRLVTNRGFPAPIRNLGEKGAPLVKAWVERAYAELQAERR